MLTSALIFASVLAYLTRRRSKVFALNLVAATAVGAMIAVWAIWINPVNQLVNGWTPATLPVDWSAYRDRWHLLHAIRLTLASVGLSALILGLLADDRGSGPHVREPARGRKAGGSGRQRPAHA